MSGKTPKPKPIGVQHGDTIKCGPFRGKVRISGGGKGKRFTIVSTSELPVEVIPLDKNPFIPESDASQS